MCQGHPEDLNPEDQVLSEVRVVPEEVPGVTESTSQYPDRLFINLISFMRPSILITTNKKDRQAERQTGRQTDRELIHTGRLHHPPLPPPPIHTEYRSSVGGGAGHKRIIKMMMMRGRTV